MPNGLIGSKIPKGSVLYLHAPGGRYDCADCASFIPECRRCIIHGPDDDIDPRASCGYFLPGPYGTDPALGFVTKAESGYVESVNGASCKRCEYWNPAGDCLLVDKDSPGDDPGVIHGDACCVLWEEK
jgi:hypothetical protein